MRYGQTILLVGIILAFAASVGVSADHIVEAVVHTSKSTMVDLRVDAGHRQLFRLSFSLVPAPRP
jgi:hypothetical protein